jgi:predicted nucleotidyltransferase
VLYKEEPGMRVVVLAIKYAASAEGEVRASSDVSVRCRRRVRRWMVEVGDEVDHGETRVRIKQMPVPRAKVKTPAWWKQETGIEI